MFYFKLAFFVMKTLPDCDFKSFFNRNNCTHVLGVFKEYICGWFGSIKGTYSTDFQAHLRQRLSLGFSPAL